MLPVPSFASEFPSNTSTTFEHIGEECGVVGIAASKRENVAALAYYALYALQHRGQQSAGIAVNDDGVINA